MTDKTDAEKTVSFGFEEVSPDEKVSRVKGVFRSVASRYDVMNDLMSAGVHRLWKHDTIAKLNPQPGERLLDVAGGTGDLAKAFIDRADRAGKRRGKPEKASAVVCDINDAMLDAGRARRDMAAYDGRIGWVCGDAQALPFEDRSVDALTIAFGIRNVADRDAALSEFRRVLKPGGRLGVLEFSHMTVPAFQALYDTYSFNVIPAMGQAVTGDRDSYQYLVESIRKFPAPTEFSTMLGRAGFKRVKHQSFTGNIATLFSGWKL